MKHLLTLLAFTFSAFASSPVVRFETTLGNFDLELNSEKAPISVENFLHYVDSGFYNGTIVHRVVKNFVIQAGGLTPNMLEKPTQAPIKNEAGNGLSNLRGTIGMARTQVVDSATSQFFINTKDNIRLDHVDETPEHFGYAVFGKVVSGMDVVDKIESVQVQTVGEYENVPVNTILVVSAQRL